jgi:carnitine O-palmitoyltransferase 1
LELKQLCDGFQKNEGVKLNRYATVYSWYAKNYVTDFWQKYLYLYGRDPLLINSNIGHIDTIEPPTNTSQVSRAADLCYIAAINMCAIADQGEKPVAGGLVSFIKSLEF